MQGIRRNANVAALDANAAVLNEMTLESLSNDEKKIIEICGIESMDGNTHLREIGF